MKAAFRLLALVVLSMPISAWDASAFSITYSYDGSDRLTRAVYGNGMAIEYSYDAAGSMLSRSVSLAPASIVLSTAVLDFGSIAISGGAVSRSVTVSNGGSGSIDWTAASDNGVWLSAAPASGTEQAPARGTSVSVTVDPSGLAVGSYVGSVTFTAAGVSNSPRSVEVRVSVVERTHYGNPVPSQMYATLQGTMMLVGQPLAAADEVAAYSVHPRPGAAGKWERVLVGHAVADGSGQLPAVTIYGDDPSTADVVEGCLPGEEILLVLWSNADGKEYHAYLDNATGNPARLVWAGDGAQLAPELDFVEGQRIPLRRGAWNLLSHGVLKGYYAGISPPANPQLAGVAWEPVASMGDAAPFKSIEGRYDRVLANDGSGAKVWNPALPQYSTLAYLGPAYGYWIKMKASADGQPLAWMTVPGAPAAGSESLALNTGWTLTGYWGNERTYFDNSVSYNATGELLPVSAEEFAPVNPIGEIWSSLAGSYGRVTSFDGQGAHLWNPSLPQTRTLRYLGPGYGYWIKMNAPGTMTYPAGTR